MNDKLIFFQVEKACRMRAMDGKESLQPRPKGPFPEPESYGRESGGPNPEWPGLVAIGTVKAPVPVTGFAVKFSAITGIAPPPLGSETEGAWTKNF
jgi:hypothetical protein